MDFLHENMRAVLAALYIAGGILALCLIAWEQKKKEGGAFFSHILRDIEEQPIPGTLGYLLTFLGSWLMILHCLFTERLHIDKDGNVKQ